MNVRWLQDFLAVAETGNFTRAAALRNTSQAAFSRRVQSLEAWVGAPLIDRSFFPTRLTKEGEQFRHHASEILRQLSDARAEVSGEAGARADHIRIGIPFALATTRLPGWWADWTATRKVTASLLVGNIHDLATDIVSGNMDLMMCFHNAQEPVHLDPERFERVQIATDALSPYVRRDLFVEGGYTWPGHPAKPLPLLMYSRGIYFARLVDAILESAPASLHGNRVLECDMTDVLREMALSGYGVAWLPESSIRGDAADKLVRLGGAPWSTPLSVVVFKDRANDRPALARLWAKLADAEASDLSASQKPRTRTGGAVGRRLARG
ncbi:LysR family transcriptional regulator [Lacibacterium aquatile]|uniref:LysR family transcriptional regulator n=1 Tax=Lacibacterium aquatile TaxID=1168082 RepID=A0ABW5DNT6_9PROT